MCARLPRSPSPPPTPATAIDANTALPQPYFSVGGTGGRGCCARAACSGPPEASGRRDGGRGTEGLTSAEGAAAGSANTPGGGFDFAPAATTPFMPAPPAGCAGNGEIVCWSCGCARRMASSISASVSPFFTFGTLQEASVREGSANARKKRGGGGPRTLDSNSREISCGHRARTPAPSGA